MPVAYALLLYANRATIVSMGTNPGKGGRVSSSKGIHSHVDRPTGEQRANDEENHPAHISRSGEGTPAQTTGQSLFTGAMSSQSSWVAREEKKSAAEENAAATDNHSTREFTSIQLMTNTESLAQATAFLWDDLRPGKSHRPASPPPPKCIVQGCNPRALTMRPPTHGRRLLLVGAHGAVA